MLGGRRFRGAGGWKMEIIIDISIEEFCSYCARMIVSEQISVLDALNKSLNHAFESSLSKSAEFIAIKRVDECHFNDDELCLTPSELIESHDCSIKWIKFKIDFKNKLLINNISIRMPEFIILENNSPDQKKYWIKIKELKTKATVFLDFIRIRFADVVLDRLATIIGDAFFDENLSILGGFKHTIIRNNMHSKEKLPLPYVYYPDSTGTFIGFKKEINSEFVFCECQKKAITNYIYMRLFGKTNRTDDPYLFNSNVYFNEIDRRFILDPAYFPYQFVADLHQKKVKQDISIIEYFNFRNGICHECNKSIPGYNYCIPYTKFYKMFGWYINKRIMEYGINRNTFFLELPENCPQNIKNLYSITDARLYEFPTYSLNNSDINEIENNYHTTIDKVITQIEVIKNNVRNEIENEVRDAFGYKRIGEEWISETILYKEIKRSLSDIKVIHHGKPEWLGKQHFDIWIPGKKVAIEYQGAQHYKPIQYFGGEEGFLKTRERDKRKKELCNENGVLLIYVDEEDSIQEVIKKIHLTTAST